MEESGRSSLKPMLLPEEVHALQKLYTDRYREYGVSPKTAGWSSEAQQKLRFDILSQIGDLRGGSVCDVGCGLGELNQYFKDRGASVDFTGIDICPELVEGAAKRFPESRFLSLDILSESFQETYDWVLMSGALNFRVHDNWAYSQAMLRKMFLMAKKGVAVNFLTSYVDFEAPINYHHRPEEVFTFAMSLTRKVIVRHDYPLWEFTLMMLK